MRKKITVLDSVRRGNWYFRASTLQDSDSDLFSIMITAWNRRHKDKLYIRFFTDEGVAAAFVDECAAGKYGDLLEDYEG